MKQNFLVSFESLESAGTSKDDESRTPKFGAKINEGLFLRFFPEVLEVKLALLLDLELCNL